MNFKQLRIVTSILLFTPFGIFAQAPTLGTAAGFVAFTSVGAVGNTGNSHLTGNVGTNSGSSTGFGNVDGVMHDNDGASSACATDLLLAYTQLNNTIPTATHAPLLGNGDTLDAGVYSVTGSTTLSNNLVLNGQNNANAVFIFKIQGPLSTTTASQIILINGAKACNVFWKVEGLISMASGTVMKGTVIANNAAINLGTGVKLEGRVLSTSGAVSVSSLTAATPVGCGSVILTGPAAPVLTASVCYAIFSGNGAVTNAGITTVTGDVGTNSGLTVGFNPLLVTGMIHPVPDISTAACAADLLNVYSYLNTLPFDIELLYPAQFGNNLVLTPHTYLLNAATSLTDTLILNAQGNPNAVFVIKINGALLTSTFATVILTNGAQAVNVFWKVEGAVNINNNSVFAGTIVCNNGAVSLNTGTVLAGRALTTNGALSTAASAVTMPSGCGIALPLNWLYFRGKPSGENVVLEWSTAREVNNDFYTLQKSIDGKNFTTLATVNAAKEAGKDSYVYNYTDEQPYSLGYYKILQSDNNGKQSSFRTIQVKADGMQSFKAVSYIRDNAIYVQVSGAMQDEQGSLAMYSTDGKKMSVQNILLTKESSIYTMEKPPYSGIFLLYITSQGRSVYHGKIAVK